MDSQHTVRLEKVDTSRGWHENDWGSPASAGLILFIINFLMQMEFTTLQLIWRCLKSDFRKYSVLLIEYFCGDIPWLFPSENYVGLFPLYKEMT